MTEITENNGTTKINDRQWMVITGESLKMVGNDWVRHKITEKDCKELKYDYISIKMTENEESDRK